MPYGTAFCLSQCGDNNLGVVFCMFLSTRSATKYRVHLRENTVLHCVAVCRIVRPAVYHSVVMTHRMSSLEGLFLQNQPFSMGLICEKINSHDKAF